MEEDKWISVEYRLPSLSDLRPPAANKPMPIQNKILVATKGGKVFETIYTCLGFANAGTDSVTHWMALPNPPICKELQSLAKKITDEYTESANPKEGYKPNFFDL